MFVRTDRGHCRPDKVQVGQELQTAPLLPAVSSLPGFRTPAPCPARAPAKGRCPKPFSIPVVHCVFSSLRRLRTAEIRTRSERESEMLRVVLNAWVTKTTAAEILHIPRPEGVKSR